MLFYVNLTVNSAILQQVLEPDEVIVYPAPSVCGKCGGDVSVEQSAKIIKRQVFELPVPKLIVTEHQVAVKECPKCHHQVQGSFPVAVKAPVQYGARIKAVAAYLHHQHFIPEDRLSEVMSDLFGCRLTPATLANTTKAKCRNRGASSGADCHHSQSSSN